MWKIKAELIFKTVVGYVIIGIALSAFSWLIDKAFNALLMFMSYLSTRWVFPLTYHTKTDKGCIMFTIACFSIAIIIALPIKLSIVASVIIGMAISTFLFFLQYFLDLKASTKVNDKEAFIAKCKSCGYNDLKTEMAVKFFIDNEKPKDVWLWLLETKKSDMEWDSVRRLKCIMKKELFK